MTTSSNNAVYAEGLGKSFGSNKVLDDLNFAASAGTVLGVLGPNGAGKTTTIKILSTLLKPDSGKATVAGYDVVREAAKVRASIMMTGQYAAVDMRLSARQNLVLFGRLMGMRRSFARTRADELLEEFELVDAATRPVATFSGGMRRRLDLACGLVIRPKVIFLDEPTTGLDPRSRRAVFALVEQLRDQGATIILTTQYLEEADILADSIIVIDHGRTIASGTPDQLKELAGGTLCRIELAHAAQADMARSALAALIDQSHQRSTEPEMISFPAPDGAHTLTEAIRSLDAAGIDLVDIALARPTLDDVFLSITHQSGSGA